MSPEYTWRNMPDKLKTFVRDELKKISRNEAYGIHQGCAFILDSSKTSVVKFVAPLSELTAGQRADGKKATSPWQILVGLEGTSHHKKFAHRDDDATVLTKLHRRTERPRLNWR